MGSCVCEMLYYWKIKGLQGLQHICGSLNFNGRGQECKIKNVEDSLWRVKWTVINGILRQAQDKPLGFDRRFF